MIALPIASAGRFSPSGFRGIDYLIEIRLALSFSHEPSGQKGEQQHGWHGDGAYAQIDLEAPLKSFASEGWMTPTLGGEIFKPRHYRPFTVYRPLTQHLPTGPSTGTYRRLPLASLAISTADAPVSPPPVPRFSTPCPPVGNRRFQRLLANSFIPDSRRFQIEAANQNGGTGR
jgi:hypothetical protein